jgi:hypothetical protein
MKRLGWAATVLAAAACRPTPTPAPPPVEPRWPVALVDEPVNLCVFEPPPHWEERAHEVPTARVRRVDPRLQRERLMHDAARVDQRSRGSG